MSLRLYDTRARAVRFFEPVTPGVATVYVCGPTVQSPPHVGHARSAVAFDVLHRWLLASSYGVVFVRNVTDIDDKILRNAGDENVPWWALATRNARAFTEAYDALRVLPPTVEPRATGHVPEMLALITRLIDAGHAYPSGGDVYFDVRSYAGYGSLSGQNPDAMAETEKTDPQQPKRDRLDFARWKGAKPGEPAWETPWGPGRPGWHVECSAMATRYLGVEFDIHGGGLDLLFPHHENEAAQSLCAGDPFARLWMHNGLVNTGGEKMSKSLGNSLVVADVLERARPQALRYYLGAPHYRSDLEWTEEGLIEADTAYTRIETFVRNALDVLGGVREAQTLALEAGEGAGKLAWEAFAEAMDDDLAVPRALGVVHGVLRRGNSLLAGTDRAELAATLAVLRRMLTVLAIDPVAQWPDSGAGRLADVVDALVSVVLDSREAARRRKDFAEADRVRDALTAAGVVVEDTPAGPRWRVS